MAKKKRHDDSHLSEMMEWQEHQYTPWSYFSKAKLPPYLLAKGNHFLAACEMFIYCGMLSIAYVAVVIGNNVGYSSSVEFLKGIETKRVETLIFHFEPLSILFATLLLMPLIILAFLAGRGHLKAHKRQKSSASAPKQKSHR